MAILSVQSRVVSGYVGNSAATPLLQRMGHTVWPIDTVVFSNHPAHGRYRGDARAAAEITALVDGLESLGSLSRCDAVLSGYLGTAGAGPAVLDAVSRCRAANPAAIWCCDPVIGDNGTVYVADGIAEFFRRQALPAADIITPNAFEAGILCDMAVKTVETAVRAAAKLRAAGPRIVVITGIVTATAIVCVVATPEAVWTVRTPNIDAPTHGAGDMFAALFLGHLLHGHDAATAAAYASGGVQAIFEATAAARPDATPFVRMLETAVRPDKSIKPLRLS